MKIKPTEEIARFLLPFAEETGVEIVEVRWDGRAQALTVFIDAPGGVDMDTCERFHRAIDAPLDELDPTFGAAYTLNCSSPGLDRPFRTARDYERHIGEAVEVHLYAPIDKSKYYEGILLSYDGAVIRILTDKGERELPASKAAKVCLLIEV